MRAVALPALAVVALCLAAAPASAQGDGAACRVLEFDFTPADELQMVIWLEDAQGNFVDTVYITRLTGTYGLGNRPGMMEFNSAWAWPYGRRVTVFPVWSHRHGMEWPQILFQNGDETNLSHPLAQSSRENFYCRPLRPGETAWDTQTCASIVFTDKGFLSTLETSRYPPRADLTYDADVDHPDVASYPELNPFDAVSRATPPGGQPYKLIFAIPDAMPPGDYVAWAEVSKEFDQNAEFAYPSPEGIPWSEYGLAYRGQPSVVYRVPFTLGTGTASAATDAYAGWGDPEGFDGDLREPDAVMITEGVDGSGASRLLLVAGDAERYRLRVSTRPTDDQASPGAPGELQAIDLTATEAVVSFVAPGNDAMTGTAAGYEIRVMAGTPMTEDNFGDAMPAADVVAPEPAGTVQTLALRNLEPSTNYYVGIRAYDECLNYGPVAVLHLQTPREQAGSVDACFVATAAFGSLMQRDVSELRKFRDAALRSHVAGELLVQGYYTFGPALARFIAPSDTLRAFARAALRPAVAMATRATASGPARLLKRLATAR